VSLNGPVSRTAFSDSNGSFSFEGMAAGRYPLSAQKPGFFGTQERGQRNALIEVGPNLQPPTILLAPESIIFGRLLDANGQPIESVGVRLVQHVVRNGALRWEQRGFANSDDEGTFRFANLQPGTYFLSAGPDVSHKEGLFADDGQPRNGWPGVYYPGAPDLASAAPVRITAGQHVEADITMNRVPLYMVSGMVSGYMPGQHVSLLVQNSSGDNVGVGTEFHSDTGLFEVHLPAGNYRIRAISQVDEQQLRADVRLAVNNNLTQLHIALQPAVSMPIHVRMEDHSQTTSPAPGRSGSSQYVIGAMPANVHLIASEPGGSDAYSVATGPAANRAVSLRGVEPGRYTAEISSYGGWYVESAQCGNTNLLTEDLIVGPSTNCSVEVTLRNDAGTLNGTIKSSGGVESGTVLLVPVRRRNVVQAVGFYSATPSAQPQFSTSSLAPGEYLVFAFDNIDGVEYSNPEALQPYISQATAVTISGGQTAKVTVPLIQTGAGVP
jgi:hypothetical protein